MIQRRSYCSNMRTELYFKTHRESRESFPGKLTIPSTDQSLKASMCPSSPPPPEQEEHPPFYLSYIENSELYRHMRSMSTSTYATQCSQRTQSTQAIPTRTLSNTKMYPHRRTRTSFASSTGRGGGATTPLHFLKKTIRGAAGGAASGRVGDSQIDAYVELEPEPVPGFKYAATPSVGTLHTPAADPNQSSPPSPPPELRRSPVPIIRTRSLPPSRMSDKHRCMGILEGLKIFEDLKRQIRKLLCDVGSKASGWKVAIRFKAARRGSSRHSIREIIDHGYKKPEVARVLTVIDTLPETLRRSKQTNGVYLDTDERTIRIKNTKNGICVFILYDPPPPSIIYIYIYANKLATSTSNPTNPSQVIETPIPLCSLKMQVFQHNGSLVRALEEWNRHFQNPPPHWLINFVPKAYLKRGWHLAEQVVEYLHKHGLDLGAEGVQIAEGLVVRGGKDLAWRVEYEAIGHKACLVGKSVRKEEKIKGSSLRKMKGETQEMEAIAKVPVASIERWRPPVSRSPDYSVGVDRHPSRVWERKEGWEGCKGLVIGIAL